MLTLEEMRALVEELRAKVAELANSETRSTELDVELDAAIKEFEARSTELAVMEERAAKVAAIGAAKPSSIAGTPNIIPSRDLPAVGDVRSLSNSDARDAALRIAESRSKVLGFTKTQEAHFERMIRTQSENLDGGLIARRAVLTETLEYRSGWQKYILGQGHAITGEEARALAEYRAMNEGTGSAGGYGVPVMIDPTIMLTSQAQDAPILSVCRVETITTKTWNGVTSAGSAWGYGSEAGVVADGSPTLAQPAITAQRATGFIPYSVEVEQDYPGFVEEIAMLLGAGYIDLIANKTLNGSGTPPTPKGLLTALLASSGACVATTTAGVLCLADVQKVHQGLITRFRNRANWMMNVATEDAIRAFSTSGPGGSFSVDLTQDGIPKLIGKNVLLSDYAPAQPTGTTAGAIAVIGDFEHFVFVKRAGMELEPIKNLMDPTTGYPVGQRGFLGIARHGYDVTSTNAFRLLVNKTS